MADRRTVQIPSPLEERSDYGLQADALPEPERELVTELTRHADICRFFEQKAMQIPPHIVIALRGLQSLPAQERVQILCDLNLELMEYLEHVSENSELRM